MKPIAALRLPVAKNLGGFVRLLRRLQVPHRVTEEGPEQVLWVPTDDMAEQVRELHARYPDGDSAPMVAQPALPGPGRGISAWRQLRASPVTTVVLLLCLLVGAISLLGENLEPLHWLTFVDFHQEGDYAWFKPWIETLEAGQWWRLVTPMFIHFGILHLTMNGLWYWELGRRIEWRQGSLALAGLTLLYAGVSNLTQYLWSGPALFGGLSGVLYALLGHVWLFNWLAPSPLYRLPKGVLIMMLAWLGLCLLGAASVLGFGEIANGAHVGGLLVGCITGLLGGALARRKMR
ncbi:rhomboid family intramembrane serine protease [Pseudomonas sp. RIT-PI-S]|uniref:rhomboid family intramembrane serine protease n=1 Tax=Pseudomonas sp. RIT-PI-S TaxID=3035295 RepID=UPI0021D94F62|nr:rhomboid family intramembrane serine protease [Pseudomonas sp. RIT-PI-S]